MRQFFYTNSRVNKLIGQERIPRWSQRSLCTVRKLSWGVRSVRLKFSALSSLSGPSTVRIIDKNVRTIFLAKTLHGLDECWFQKDGAPPHFALGVRERLNEHFRRRWIGRRGAKEWPPRSPDLTHLDFWFLWSHQRDRLSWVHRQCRTLENKNFCCVWKCERGQGLAACCIASPSHFDIKCNSVWTATVAT